MLPWVAIYRVLKLLLPRTSSVIARINILVSIFLFLICQINRMDTKVKVEVQAPHPHN